jgi:hypothetical protein
MHGKTTSTPVRAPFGSGLPGSGRMFHISTNYRWMELAPNTPAKFVKVGKGMTYRKESTRG